MGLAGKKGQLKDSLGNILYPQTKTSLVLKETGEKFVPVTAADAEKMIESKKYQTEAQVNQKYDSKGYTSTFEAGAILEQNTNGYVTNTTANDVINSKNLQGKLTAGENIRIDGTTINVIEEGIYFEEISY